MKSAIVVGSGAGGATIAKELQGKFNVTILEEGREFRPFSMNLNFIEKLKRTGLLFDEREIKLIFPTMKIRKTADSMVLVNGIGLGGTTTLTAGNGLRVDDDLKILGIDLDEEFDELRKEIPFYTGHRKKWHKTTRRLFGICEEMGLEPEPLPKMGSAEKCKNCGRCILGCPHGAKWDSRQFLNKALENGAHLITDSRVMRVLTENGRAIGVETKEGWRSRTYKADYIILSAGGFGTPAILERSGINCEPKLFVDPVLCVACEWEGALMNKEISMPFAVEKDGYILAPYFDYLSYFFNRAWRPGPENIVSLMIKLADSNCGSVHPDKIEKTLTEEDKKCFEWAVDICTEILGRMGVAREKIFLGTLNAGHPGGTLPLGPDEADTFHSRILPSNVYVSDASLLPDSMGKPPSLTIMAVAKRIAKLIAAHA
jgi:choline dehydrogenase-like flavoprotein